jgi:hypothetical protein
MDYEHLCEDEPVKLLAGDRHKTLTRWMKHWARNCIAMFRSLPSEIINTLSVERVAAARKLNEV